MRIIVYGAGAVGSVIGGYLYNAGYNVILVCSKPNAEAISKSGLQINGIKGDFNIKLPVVDTIEAIDFKKGDIIFLTMKTFDTKAAIERISKNAYRMKTVCFQNAVRNEELAAEKFDSVYGGIVFFGAKYLEPGIIIHTAEDNLGIGRYPDGVDEFVKDLCETLNAANFTATPYPNIMAVKWSKLFRNLSNALFGITGMSLLEGLKYEAPRMMMANILEEAQRVVQAEGIEIVPLEGHQPVDKMIASLRRPGEWNFEISNDEKMTLRPSTWQDLFLKRGRTEVEYLNGEIVQMGNAHGIKTPYNSLMVKIVSEMAEQRRQPGVYTVDQINEMIQ
jgi:2-dehydropantoate 2-reductase